MIKPLFYRKKNLYFGDKTFILENKTFEKKPLFLKIRVDGLPQDNQHKDRMAVIHLLSGDVPEATVFETINQIGKAHDIFVDLESKPVVQQIIRDIHETLRTIVRNNTDLFQENGNFINCSVQLHPTKDKVLNIKYYLL